MDKYEGVMDKYESFAVLALEVVGSIAFGFWQGHWGAGITLFVVLALGQYYCARFLEDRHASRHMPSHPYPWISADR